MKARLSLIIPLALVAAVAPMAIGQKGGAKAKFQNEIEAALPEKAFAKPKKKRKLLVFSVTNGFRHRSIPTGQLSFALMGEKTGAYEAVVSDDLANFESDKIKEFDAICFLNTTGNVFVARNLKGDEKKAAEERGKRLQENLASFIREGGGFVGIHSATDTNYQWKEYGEMINGYFDGHPWGAGTQVSIAVDKSAVKHPIVDHLEGENLNFKEEIYQLKDPYDSSKVQMLLRLDLEKSEKKNMKRTDGDYGVSWVRKWGKGRVFYCSLGHNDAMYFHPDVLKIYLGGIQYALGDFDVPSK